MVTDELTYRGDQFVMNINVEPLCCTPETNIMLLVNYTSKKKKKRVEKRG